MSFNKDVNMAEELVRLRKENEILRTIIEEIPASIYWKSLDGTYLGRNMFSVEKMIEQGFEIGQNRDSVVGKTDYDLFPQEIAEKFATNDKKIISSGQEELLEESFINLSGKEYHHLSIKKPLYDNNKIPLGIVGISLDITSLKEAEKREKAALLRAEEEAAKANSETEMRRSISIFAGSIGHDLRTLLTSMSLNLDLFQKKYIPKSNQSDKKEYYIEKEHAHSFYEKLKKVVHEMNDFITITLQTMRRLMAGSLTENDFVMCEIETCLNEVLAKYPLKTNEELIIHLTHIENFEFFAHPVLFYRILFNLIANSLQQISKNGHGEIYISAEKKEKMNILRFKDTAGGASPEIIQHLFDGYQTTKKEGTGIGLAFSKLTMQSLGGDITCQSVEGDYIEFTLSFPQLKIEENPCSEKNLIST